MKRWKRARSPSRTARPYEPQVMCPPQDQCRDTPGPPPIASFWQAGPDTGRSPQSRHAIALHRASRG